MALSQEEKIINVPPLDFTPDPRGIGCVLFDSMLKYQNKVAQIDGLTGEKDLYRNVLQRSVRVAIALQKRGIVRADVISICSYNHLDTITPVLAALFLGASVCGIDECLRAEDAANSLIKIKPKIVFVQNETVTMIENALDTISHNAEIVVFEGSHKHTPFSEFLKPSVDEEIFLPVPVKTLTDTAMIFFTSGSTGVPKPICHNHISMLYQTANLINCNYDWTVALEYTSPYWTVFASFFTVTTMLGKTRLIYRDVTEALILCKLGRPKNLSLDNVKYLIIGGNYLTESQLKMVKELFWEAHVLFGYAQSEVPGSLLMFKPAFENELKLMQAKITSVGTGVAGISYKIVDEVTEKTVGPGKKGELRIKTVFPLGLLYKMDSSDLVDSNGWLKTGDLACYDKDKCFYIVGRIKDMFKYRSYRIIPSTIQTVLLSHRAVDEAIVIGIPHETDSEHPMGVVILKHDCKNVSAKEIEKYVEEKVHDSHRLRAGVKILDELVKTATGKVRKNVIRDLIIQGKL
ncbi:hypothetical protein RN001_015469 [Aquatica leii]|uniref:Uncharacterized protein n=1 Tax=Aquatica leii TaxID=1421715 RepID=A0AAN7PZE0_9COLE|nr:hypothetical protein RN001_015469 [Aquatica leii]